MRTTRRPGAGDDDELRLVVQKLARRIRAERTDEPLSDGQLSVLFHLDAQGPTTPGRLAEREHVTPPSMNRTLNHLEAAGLVVRTPSPDDARRVDVTITDAAGTLIGETRRLRTAWFGSRLAELAPNERLALEAVTPILRKLAES
jgi:DNA-binding MarR family transcriptional regulator